MGNTIAGRKRAKVMKIDGETYKFKTPIQVWNVIKDHPGHVLLESEAVKQLGIRAKPLEPQQELKPKKVYFLVQLPKFSEQDQRVPRRVRSGVHMSAKDRLECLMLSRRSVSDLPIARSSLGMESGGSSLSGGIMQEKMRVPKSQLSKLMEESKDEVEMAENIIKLYRRDGGSRDGSKQEPWKPELGGIRRTSKKRVSFAQKDREGEIGVDRDTQ